VRNQGMLADARQGQ